MRRTAMLLAVGVCTLASACALPELDEPSPNMVGAELGGDGKSPAKKVTYRVTGPAKASVTYSTDGAGGTAQDNGTALPWKKTIKADDVYGIYSVTAQNDGETGKIRCVIEIDGKVVERQQSSGAYALVSCNKDGG